MMLQMIFSLLLLFVTIVFINLNIVSKKDNLTMSEPPLYKKQTKSVLFTSQNNHKKLSLSKCSDRSCSEKNIPSQARKEINDISEADYPPIR